MSHEEREVPLAPQAWRVENGVNSGDDGPSIATALAADVMQVVTAVRDAQWTVEDDTAVVFYTIDVDPGRLPGVQPGAPTSSLRLGERFRVWDGLIAEIEVVIPALPALPVSASHEGL